MSSIIYYLDSFSGQTRVKLSARVSLCVTRQSHDPPSEPSSVSLSGLLNSRNTSSPIDPDSIQVPVSYEPDPADLALSSVPGQEIFDPRKRKFSVEELKPQPMIKKARKVFIPDEMKVTWSWFCPDERLRFRCNSQSDLRVAVFREG